MIDLIKRAHRASNGLVWLLLIPLFVWLNKDPKHSVSARKAAQINAATGPVPARTFSGSDCTDDCSGHEAGYAWASRNAVSESFECGGKSQSFIEGCEAYLEDTGEQADLGSRFE